MPKGIYPGNKGKAPWNKGKKMPFKERRPMTDEHKRNLSKSLIGRKGAWEGKKRTEKN